MFRTQIYLIDLENMMLFNILTATVFIHFHYIKRSDQYIL